MTHIEHILLPLAHKIPSPSPPTLNHHIVSHICTDPKLQHVWKFQIKEIRKNII